MDAQGLLLGVLVHAASIRGDGAGHLLGRIKPSYCWLQTVFADSIYNRVATLLACFLLGITLVIVDRIPGTESFVVLPRRRVVEKTFGWLGRWRHLSKDYEHLPEVSEAMVTLPMIRLVLHRVARPNRKRQAATALWLLKRSLSSASCGTCKCLLADYGVVRVANRHHPRMGSQSSRACAHARFAARHVKAALGIATVTILSTLIAPRGADIGSSPCCRLERCVPIRAARRGQAVRRGH